MIVLDPAMGVRPSRGWVHYACQQCDDPSQHFGVQWEKMIGHCLRCGYTSHEIKKSGDREGPARQRRSSPLPSYASPSLAVSSLFPPMRLPWEGLDVGVLERLGAQALCTRRGLALRLPFIGGSYMLRYLDGRKPKTRSFGPHAPVYRLLGQGNLFGQVVVEGWADGAVLPPGYRATVLCGTGAKDSARAIAREEGDIYLAMDQDLPGQHGGLLLGLRLLRLRPRFFWVKYEGKDPAQRGGLSTALQTALPVTNVKELLCAVQS